MPNIGMSNAGKITVEKLRASLKSLGVSTKGNKEELLNRLKECGDEGASLLDQGNEILPQKK